MKYIVDPILGLIASLFGLVIHPIFAVLFGYLACTHSVYWVIGVLPFALGVIAVLCAQWDRMETDGYIRGDLPEWANAYATLDERLPGDVRGEPSVKWAYAHLGKTLCAMYWLLERNRGMGLSYLFSSTLPDGVYLDGDKWGWQELPNGAWRMVWRIGSFGSFGFGNQTTKADGVLWRRPWFAIKRQHGGNP